MEYLLSQSEYDKLTKSGNEQLTIVIEALIEVGRMKDDKTKLIQYDNISSMAAVYQQNGWSDMLKSIKTIGENAKFSRGLR